MRMTPYRELPRIDRWAQLAALAGNAVTVEFLAGLRAADQLRDNPGVSVISPYAADTYEARGFGRGMLFGLYYDRSAATDPAR